MKQSAARVWSRRVRIAAYAFFLILTLGLLEGGSRLVLLFEDEVVQALGLRFAAPVGQNGYLIADTEKMGLWKLRPGYTVSAAELLEDFREEGRELGIANLERALAQSGLAPETMALSINSDGFKGPEIDHAHSRFRILAIGDSVTFGPNIDWYAYPRVLERELAEMNISVEIINGAVPGYGPKQGRWPPRYRSSRF